MGMKIYAIRALQISQFLFKTAAAQGKNKIILYLRTELKPQKIYNKERMKYNVFAAPSGVY